MLLSWFKALRNRRRLEREMDEELHFHIDSYASDLGKQGFTREEAMRRARLEFGGLEGKKEECRESLGWRLLDELRGDLKSGLRVLRQSPVFTAVAVISLALGIGANTAIFTVANSVLLKTMAVPDAGRLRLFMWAHGLQMRLGPAWGAFDRNDRGETTGTPFPYELYREMRRHNTAMDDLAAFKDVYQLTATVGGEPESVDGVLVSGNFYGSLGARVEAGRAITPADDAAGADPVVVISDAYWSKRFGRSADVLGRTIDLNRLPVTIVGVNGAEFKGPKTLGSAEVFFPLSLQQQVIPNPKGSLQSQSGYWWLMVTGRLKAGMTEQAAEAALAVAFRNAFRATIPGRKESDIPRFYLAPGSRGLDLMQRMKKPIYLLLAVAALVLLIACANVANLLLARAAARQREISLRVAMGAGRMRIVRQILTESLLLAFLGGAAGLVLGYAGRNFIPRLFDNSWQPSSMDVQMDWRVFLFAFLVTAATGLLFGMGPAWRSTNAEANSALKETGRMSTSRPKALLGRALVVFQVALSLVLVVVAGLFVRTLMNLQTAPTGINPEHVVLFEIRPPQARYSEPQRVALFRKIADGLAVVPGVEKITSSSEPLLANSMDDDCFRPTGRDAGTAMQDHSLTNYVGADFFETFGIPIIMGRPLNARDDERAPKVVVVNQQLAKAFFPGKSPLGQTLSACGDKRLIEVVGVSADAKYSEIRGDVPLTMYFPYAQADDLMSMTFEVKTAASLGSIAPKMRAVVKAADKDLPVLELRTQTEQINATLAQERVFATLTSGFGVLALVLASIGIYGVMAYTVARRTNEIGIRMALGARAREVLTMVLGETSVLACVGIVVGVGFAVAATKVIASMLFGVEATDPLTFVSGVGLLFLVALLAAVIPAWRAARVDPVNALRHE